MNLWLQISLTVLSLSGIVVWLAKPYAGRRWPHDNIVADIICAIAAVLLIASLISTAMLLIWSVP